MIQCNDVLYNIIINPSYPQTIDISSVLLPSRPVTLGDFQKVASHHLFVCLNCYLTPSFYKSFVFS
jgi:hypothetical protein